jgi:MFS family permease
MQMFNKLVLESKNIAIIYSSMLISGLLFFLPILALYYEKDLFSLTNVAIIFAVEAIAFAFFEMPSGAISDLFGRKRTIISSYIISIIALVFLYIGGSMIIFILYAIINAFAKSLISGTDSALIYDTLKEEKKERSYKKVIGTYYALWPVGASIGSIIGGHLASVSLSLPILMTFIPLLIATMLTFFLKEPYYEKENHRNIFRHMLNSLKIIINNKQLIILILGGFILMAFGETLHLLGPLFLKFKDIPIELFGWITAYIHGFSALGHYFSHSVSEKIGNKRTLLIAVFGSPLLLLLATISPKYIAMILFVIPSILFGLRNPVIAHLLNLEVSSSKRATIISASNFLGQLGVAIFAPMIGYFAELYTINTAFKISAIIMFSVPILYLFLKDKN